MSDKIDWLYSCSLTFKRFNRSLEKNQRPFAIWTSRISKKVFFVSINFFIRRKNFILARSRKSIEEYHSYVIDTHKFKHWIGVIQISVSQPPWRANQCFSTFLTISPGWRWTLSNCPVEDIFYLLFLVL